MPLSEKARIEVYLPDRPELAYHELFDVLERELTYAIGGCSVIRGVDGAYLSRLGALVRDRVSILYSDVPFTTSNHIGLIGRYADTLRHIVLRALNEEAMLIAVLPVYHAV